MTRISRALIIFQLKLLAEKYKELDRQHKETEAALEAFKSRQQEVMTPSAAAQVTSSAANDERIKELCEEKRDLEKLVS